MTCWQYHTLQPKLNSFSTVHMQLIIWPRAPDVGVCLGRRYCIISPWPFFGKDLFSCNSRRRVELGDQRAKVTKLSMDQKDTVAVRITKIVKELRNPLQMTVVGAYLKEHNTP